MDNKSYFAATTQGLTAPTSEAEQRRLSRRNAIVEGLEGQREEEREMVVLDHAMSAMGLGNGERNEKAKDGTAK